MLFTYEEKYPVVVEVISKYRNKWRLDVLHWMDFEDVASEIATHVWKKWHLWDQTKPLEPWVSRVAHHQILNKWRNLYTNYARPCIKCPHSLDDQHCAFTASKEQCSECPIYAKWQEQKKNGYDIKMPLELENHLDEVVNRESEEIDYGVVISKLKEELQKKLDALSYQAFCMLHFDGATDKEVSVFLGFKSKPQNTVTAQIKAFKENLFARVKKILRASDIPEMWN